jgi:hypothetical protein
MKTPSDGSGKYSVECSYRRSRGQAEVRVVLHIGAPGEFSRSNAVEPDDAPIGSNPHEIEIWNSVS